MRIIIDPKTINNLGMDGTIMKLGKENRGAAHRSP
jgi:hypothetical protein